MSDEFKKWFDNSPYENNTKSKLEKCWGAARKDLIKLLEKIYYTEANIFSSESMEEIRNIIQEE